jgi:hypothetical protein
VENGYPRSGDGNLLCSTQLPGASEPLAADGLIGINLNLLVLFDGTQYFSSKNISCEHCSTKDHKNGTTTYSHTALTPVIAAPDKNYIIPLAPEYIRDYQDLSKQLR